MQLICLDLMQRTEAAADQLFGILASPLKNSYTTRNIRSSVQTSLNFQQLEGFVPFVQERDGIGRLLPSLSEPSLAKSRLKERVVKTTPKLTRTSTAFSSTVMKTRSRRRKEIYPVPPLGLYDPKPTYQLQHSRKNLKTSKTHRFASWSSHTQSPFYMNYDQVYSILNKRISGFSMQRQLAREKAEHDYDNERAELYRPVLKMPDHLKKFNGLFHVSAMKAEDSNTLKKDAAEMNFKMRTIQNTITGLKDFGKEITKNMFTSKRIDELP